MLNIEKSRKLLILIAICLSSVTLAEGDAERYFAEGDWAKAADAYRLRTESDPEDMTSWFRLAVSARQLERYSVAANALDMADQRQFSPVRIGLERARLSALKGDSASAEAQLNALATSGFTAVNVITGDPVLSRLAGRPAYDSLVANMSKLAFPCEHDAAYSEFDFWIGEWDVHIGNGTYAGSNRIERTERGCLLIETWQSATGGTGSSVNYRDGISGEWVQIWNAAGGSQINIRGGMTDDGMLLTGTIHYIANGTTAPFRGLWTLLEDGRVRQYFEQQSADGESWSPWFEGFYSKRSVD